MNAVLQAAGDDLATRVAAFNRRPEITWFGLVGWVEHNGTAVVRFSGLHAGVLGGGGVAAINGGVIAAGFDAVCVLAGMAASGCELVVTLNLNVQFLRLAQASQGLAFRARATRSGATVCFVQGELVDAERPEAGALATAQATLQPRRRPPEGPQAG